MKPSATLHSMRIPKWIGSMPRATAIGVSIGTAFAAPGERDLDALLGKADQLMYEVKRSRKSSREGAGARA